MALQAAGSRAAPRAALGPGTLHTPSPGVPERTESDRLVDGDGRGDRQRIEECGIALRV